MAIQNFEVAKLFAEYADLLEIGGDSSLFRPRAYRNAARVIENYGPQIADLVKANEDLTSIPGIGKDLAAKIERIVEHGTFDQLEAKRKELGSELSKLIRIAGLGPKRVKELHQRLGISNPTQLAEAARKGQIKELPRFGEKLEAEILSSLSKKEGQPQATRMLLSQAVEAAEPLVRYLQQFCNGSITIAGSYRRKQETVGDLDILATADDSKLLMDRFASYEDATKVLAHGRTRSSIMLRSGIQVDLRVVGEESYGAALHYFTGSKAHNIRIRHLAQQKQLKVSEYGVFRDEEWIAGRTEEEVFAQVGLPFIEPELREDSGEIEAAMEGSLPNLVTVEKIRGDLHVHSKETDGQATILEMAKAAKARGYQYIAITDHSKRVAVARGLDADQLMRQIDEIDQLNEELKGITILKATEVDILEDGSLDLPNRVLSKLDLTVCSVHSKFNLSEKKQTERIIRAMDNPCFLILGHPTGRLIGKREPYQVNLEKIIEAASERSCLLEINSQPERLDLAAPYARLAKEKGVKLTISTDAHSERELDFINLGVAQARRAWLEAEDVANSRKLSELRKLLKRR